MMERVIERVDGQTVYDNGDPARAEYDPAVTNEPTVRERADQALDGLRTIRDSSGTLTGTQLSNAVRLMARVLIALVRLALRKLDDTE